jgi:chromosomal replication initiation ATPase DnaA
MIRCAPCPYNIVVKSCMFRVFENKTVKQHEQITMIVCQITGITREDIKSVSRERTIVEARMLAMAFIKLYNKNMPLKSIATQFGKADHSTVIYALNTVADLTKTNIKFRNTYQRIENAIHNNFIEKVA